MPVHFYMEVGIWLGPNDPAYVVVRAGRNDRLAVKMTVMFGSIWCVYLFTVFSLLPKVNASWQGPLLYISNCIQLVALPALMVGNAVIARWTEISARLRP